MFSSMCVFIGASRNVYEYSLVYNLAITLTRLYNFWYLWEECQTPKIQCTGLEKLF